MNLANTHSMIKDELINQVIPFWVNHSIDTTNGGYLTSIDTTGQVFDTDKFVWLQARQVWTFAMIYDELSPNQKWLEIAKDGAEFLLKHGRSPEGKWYFALDQIGQPLVADYNIFSDCFATMAFTRLYKITQETKYQKVALSTFKNILLRRDNPKGKYNKAIFKNRSLSNFSLPMILCNLCLELEDLIDPSEKDAIIADCLQLVMKDHYNEELGLIMENIDLKNGFSNTYDGRLINPGHGIEAMWFVIEIAEKNNDQELIAQCLSIIHKTLSFSWDETHGGIFYFMDALGHPPQQLEWDQKLWWVHLETLIALSKGMLHDKTTTSQEWFEMVFEYTWTRFRDPINNGEWFGYLNRCGEVLLNLKGGKWKGCFHVPRALWKIQQALSSLT